MAHEAADGRKSAIDAAQAFLDLYRRAAQLASLHLALEAQPLMLRRELIETLAHRRARS